MRARLRGLLLCVGLPVLVIALAGTYDLWREGMLTPRPPAAQPKGSLIPIASCQLTVALIPPKPSDAVVAQLRKDGTSETTARELLSDTGMQALTENLSQLWPFSYEVRAPLTLPDAYYDAARRQYRIDLVLDWLAGQHDPRLFRSVGVLSGDVYAPEYNFLFGQAKIYGPCCVASTARMGGSMPLAHKTASQRWQDIVRHELGHTLGLPHTSERSVMHYSDTLNGLDDEASDLSKSEWQQLAQLYSIKWE